MKVISIVWAFVLFFITTASYDKTIPDRAWKAKLAHTIYGSLKQSNELYIYRRNAEGKYKWKITPEYLKEQVDNAYEASAFLPSWGSRELVTIKLLSIAYGESNFDPTAINYTNNNGSMDVGIIQENSCHWFSPNGKETDWHMFCKKARIRGDFKQLWNPRVNFMFGAYLQEQACGERESCYHYYKTKNQKHFYRTLVNSLKLEQEAVRNHNHQYGRG